VLNLTLLACSQLCRYDYDYVNFDVFLVYFFCVQIIIKVSVLGFGLRHPVPSAVDRRTLQALLQYLWQRRLVHHWLLGAHFWRRAAHESATLHLLPRMERRRTTVPISHARHGPVSNLGHRLLDAHALPVRIGQTASELGHSPMRCQHPGGRCARIRLRGGSQ